MAADDPLIGKKLGDYTIQSLLGRGGMSRVYRGFDDNLARFAAVKVISGDFMTTTEEEYTRRFQSEARAIAHLRHSNIVGVYQFGRTEGIYYMAQVFLEGKDLRALLKEYGEKQQRMPHAEVVRIARDVGGALDYAHEQGVIHRDIKPSNIMLEKKSGRAILMDFGLALSVQEGTMGDTFGSAHYIAPEQAISSAKSVTQSDLYSLGIVLYEMITGRVPFDDPSVMSVALKHLNELPPPPTMFNPALPGAVEQVIMRALEKDPTRRFETCKELVDALDEAFQTMPPQPSAEVTPVSDLLDSQPRPPEGSSPSRPHLLETSSPSRPRPPVEDVKPGGLAGRFARRKAQKEELSVLNEINEGTFGLDNGEIDSLLSAMPDPRDIGLVGPEARPITLPKRPGEISLPQAPAALGKRRRSRPGVVLPLLLLLLIVAAGVWFGTRDDGGSEAEPTASSAASGPVASATPGIRVTATVPPVQATQTAAIREALAEQTRQAASAAGLVDETAQPTVRATSTPAASREPTDRPAVTVTPEASPVPTTEPTAEPSAEPTATGVPTQEPESSPAPTGDQLPNIRLIYDDEQFLLVNLSNSRLDVSRLVFEQTLPNGLMRSFEASMWDRDDIADPPDRMRVGGCYQVLVADAAGDAPSTDDCPQYLGYFQPTVSRSYFWIADLPGAKFTVRNANSDTLLATCDVGRGECEFFAPAEALAVIPTRTPTRIPSRTPSPSPAPALGTALHLYYDANAFLLVNPSNRTLDISGLVFEQVVSTSLTRHFEARDWDRAGIVVPPTRMSAESCYQLVRAEADQETPERDICATFLGWFRTGVTVRYFWISDQPGASFTVTLQGSPLATCLISAGQCTVTLPAE